MIILKYAHFVYIRAQLISEDEHINDERYRTKSIKLRQVFATQFGIRFKDT